MTEHEHAYEVKGSGASCWGECACGQKMMGEAGPIVGSVRKVEGAIKRWPNR